MDFGISYFPTKPLQSPDITRLHTPGSDHRRIQEAREERSTGKKKHVTPGHINLEGPNCAMTSVDFGGKLSIIFWEKSPNGQLGWPMIDPGDTVIP